MPQIKGIIDYEQLTKVTQQDLDEGAWDAENKGLYSKGHVNDTGRIK